MAPDGRMFQASRKGELFELKQGLNATTTKERKIALKRTVAAMTLGKDVSSLFTDVVKNTAGDLSMKKLVYLYIINYAQAKPDLAILIVNTFIKDAVDPNPLVRALAIRTMALIPLDKITEYLCDPLHRALKDEDPYVRKTAAVCVAKVYDTNPTLAVEEGFIQELQTLLSDGNPMTVSNAVAALSEIGESSQTPNLLSLTPATVPHFLSAMSECTEWGQIFILDAISSYIPSSADEADLMVERIVPRLQHSNPGVVLSAVRNIVNLMPRLDSDAKRNFLIKKMSAPLITLLTSQPELQFVVLRNVSLLIHDYPALLSSNLRVLFVSYADPLCVKTEKLGILARLVDPSTAQVVLTELVEYTGDVDVVFAQSAVDCIAKIALRLPAFAKGSVSIFSGLLKRQVVHLTEQICVALKDILRVYPNQFDDVIAQLCEVSNHVEEPDAKASLVWIIGEHAERIPAAVAMLGVILESLADETISVQLQILTACMKAYLTRGPEAQKITDSVINYATQESENMDVRDRGFVYRRLISGGFDAAQQIVLSNNQGVEKGTTDLSVELQEELIRVLSSVAAVYHKAPKTIEGARTRAPVGQPIGDLLAEEDLLGLADGTESVQSPAQDVLAVSGGPVPSSKPMGDTLLDDILGEKSALPVFLGSAEVNSDDGLSNLGMQNMSLEAKSIAVEGGGFSLSKQLLAAGEGNGLSVKGCLSRDLGKSIVLDMELSNMSTAPMTEFAIQFNKNMFGLAPASPLDVSCPLLPSGRRRVQIPLMLSGGADSSKGFALQMAIKFSPGGVVYFSLDVADHVAAVFDTQNGMLSKPAYLSTWQSVPDTSEVRASVTFGNEAVGSVSLITSRLATAGIFTVAKRMNMDPPVMYLSAVVVGPSKSVIMGELALPSKNSKSIGTIASRCTFSHKGNTEALVSFNETCAKLLA